MSERIGNIVAPPVAAPRPASVAVLFRRTADGAEPFFLKKANVGAFGGYHTFPGGGVESADEQIPVQGDDGELRVMRAAAARELFEETGVLVVTGQLPPKEERARMREALLSQGETFAAQLHSRGLSVDASALLEAGRWLTPRSLPRRFDTPFFLVELPKGQEAELIEGEHVWGRWTAVSEALSWWESGEALYHPPTLHVLQCLRDFKSPEEVAQRMASPTHCPAHMPSRIELQRGIRFYALETDTLPPAAHTNCYVLGNGHLLIVDPGATEVRELARLLALVAGLQAEGCRPLAVFLTHHHADHVGGAVTVASRLKIPIWCHRLTAERLELREYRAVDEGERIVLSGLPRMSFTVRHTPGHARGHLCLVDDRSGAAIVGDMVAGLGSILIDPPEGDMGEYVAQLARLRDLPVGVLYPSHGPPLLDGPAALDRFIRHREGRERRVLEAIEGGAQTTQEILPIAYSDTPEAVWLLAERALQAILIKLGREGRVVRDGTRYVVRSPG